MVSLSSSTRATLGGDGLDGINVPCVGLACHPEWGAIGFGCPHNPSVLSGLTREA